MATTPNVYQIITDRIVALIEAGTVPWQQPWHSEQGEVRNLLTETPYRGINVWMLGSAGYASPFWLTYNQAKAQGGHVRQGEKGYPIVFLKNYVGIDKDTGDEEKRFVLKYYTVFNSLQCEDITTPTLDTPAHHFTPIEICEKLVGNMPQKPAILHGSSQAFYRPSQDAVHMPDPTAFERREAYYSTLFHELTHSTGHADRLNRATLKDMVRFGDANYSKEELVAEMGATYLCGVCGIENATITNSAAYLNGWLSALRHDNKLLIQAAAQAQKAADFIRNLSQEAHE